MANGLVNVEGITNKEVEELAQILNELNELIGGEANTGGTATAGTVMAKLNKLLTDLTTTRAGYLDTINTNAARLTNERATKLDNIGATNNTGGTTSAGTVMAKLNKLLTDWTTARAGYLDTINSNIGATGNTGGTTTAGTVMGKLNKLLTDWTAVRAGYLDNIGVTNNTGGTTSAGTVMGKLNKLLTDWTTTRAGKIDTINSAIGTTGNTGGSATAGTIMGKLNKLLSDNVSDTTQYKISSTVKDTIKKSLEKSSNRPYYKIYQFHAKYDGCIAAYATVSNKTVNCSLYVLRSLHDYVNISGSGTVNDSITPMVAPIVFTSALGTFSKYHIAYYLFETHYTYRYYYSSKKGRRSCIYVIC